MEIFVHDFSSAEESKASNLNILVQLIQQMNVNSELLVIKPAFRK